MLEAFCAQVTQDRTDWRRLVRGETARVALTDLARQLRRRIDDFTHLNAAQFVAQPDNEELANMGWSADETVYRIKHPVKQYSPAQRRTCSEQEPLVTGVLMGIIGHFLLLDTGVFDLQAHDRAVVECSLHQKPQTPHRQSPQASLF